MSGEPVKTRRTAQKRLIASALAEQSRFVSAQTLHRELEDAGHTVGLATVYRQLHALVAAGQADSITLAEKQLFRACHRPGHHHHLVCEQCGQAVEIDPPAESWITDAAAAHGFTPTRHVVEIFGLCPTCANS